MYVCESVCRYVHIRMVLVKARGIRFLLELSYGLF